MQGSQCKCGSITMELYQFSVGVQPVTTNLANLKQYPFIISEFFKLDGWAGLIVLSAQGLTRPKIKLSSSLGSYVEVSGIIHFPVDIQVFGRIKLLVVVVLIFLFPCWFSVRDLFLEASPIAYHVHSPSSCIFRSPVLWMCVLNSSHV